MGGIIWGRHACWYSLTIALKMRMRSLTAASCSRSTLSAFWFSKNSSRRGLMLVHTDKERVGIRRSRGDYKRTTISKVFALLHQRMVYQRIGIVLPCCPGSDQNNLFAPSKIGKFRDYPRYAIRRALDTQILIEVNETYTFFRRSRAISISWARRSFMLAFHSSQSLAC